ncbi:MAG TPA: MBL fold metallo-hydrolase [Flavobacteriales bacterium]|nr:MBL fold metallo-hydrolase [Flavobacteriales bacterium]
MIKLEYLAHSSFLLTCGNKRIVFDPWLGGEAYYKQWYLWPVYPGNVPYDFDVVLISHGHEDHLHSATLRKLNKKANVFFPFQWRKGIKPFLYHLGFGSVTEAVSFKTYTVDDVKITYIGYSLESVVVVEYKNQVLVNINDALNSNHHSAVNFIIDQINKRWPEIDILLSGWSGASYFPNQVKYHSKNDVEVAKMREQYFANNFCLFTEALKPKMAIPFVTGFVLLREKTKWINHIKFPRRVVADYYKEYYGECRTQFVVPYPGDTIDEKGHTKISPLHAFSEEEVYYKAYEYYANALQTADHIHYLDDGVIQTLVADLTHWVNYNKQLYDKVVLQDAVFSIRLEDVKENEFLNIFYEAGKFIVQRAGKPLEDRKVLITTQAAKVAYGLKKMWGGDVITIGYGLEVELYDELSLEKNLDIVCVRLITRYPMAHKDLVKYPLRAAKYYLTNPAITTLWIKQKINLKPYINKFPANERDHWFTYNKCDLCQVCKMPQVDNSVYNNY